VDYQLHGADNVVGGGITHGCVPVVIIQTLEVSIGPREMDCIVLDRLKEQAEDQSHVLLASNRKAIEGVKRIGGNDLRKWECRFLPIIPGKIELDDAWNGLLFVLCPVLAAVSCLCCVVPHDMGIHNTTVSFASTIIRARLIDEEKA